MDASGWNSVNNNDLGLFVGIAVVAVAAWAAVILGGAMYVAAVLLSHVHFT